MSSFFFFNDTATTEIYTLSLHDALPIYSGLRCTPQRYALMAFLMEHNSHPTAAEIYEAVNRLDPRSSRATTYNNRSEEHTSELQSQSNLVCRLLLEKKKRAASHLSGPSL